MTESITIDWGDSIGAVKLKGKWRFFYDMDYMFLLDYTAYDSGYIPKPGDKRFGLLVIDNENAEQWMGSLAGELSLEQIPNVVVGDSSVRADLIFVIDFDTRLWVGQGWHNDQSFLGDYQPEGWTAIEDNVYQYLPDEIRRYWRTET